MKRLVTVDEACEIVTDGTHYTPENAGTGIPFLTVKDVTDLKLDFINCSFITTEDYITAKDGKSAPRKGDVLFSKDGTVGKVHVVTTDRPFAVLSSLAILRPKKSMVDATYFGHVLRSPKVLEDALKRKTGSAIRRIILSDLKKVKIPLPSLEEQKRIADILDRAEALRAKRRAALAQLDELVQSIFIEMFGDVVKNEKHWPTERMGDIMQIRRGASPRPIEKYLGGEINWIKIGDGTKDSDIYIEKCADKLISEGLKKTVFLKAGSFIFANCGVSLGFARILKVDGCIHDGWLSLEEIPEDKLDKLFLLKALNSITEHFRRIAPSGTQPNLNTGLMKDFRMILPPLPLQQEFSRRVEVINELKVAHKTSLAELDELFASLQYQAFRGKL